MSDFGILAEITIKARALRQAAINLALVIVFLTLAVLLLSFVAGPDVDDPDAYTPTVQSVTDLGREPYALEQCEPLPHNLERCR